MRSTWALLTALLTLPACQLSPPPTLTTLRADVVVYGSTPGGFCAAIAAAREGAHVLLVEPSNHVGGLSTGGLSHCDSNQMVRSTVMGLFDEWHRRIVADYTGRGLPEPYDAEKKDTAVWTFEPHVAMRVTRQMLDEAGVRVLAEHPLETVAKDGPTIRAIVAGGCRLEARVFVDGTYEGDLMAAAGVAWTIGREGRDEFGESLAGQQYPKARMEIDGLAEDGQPLPLVTAIGARDGDREGEGDDRVMTYSFRLCLTEDDANKVPMPAPDHYDPARFELVRRYLAAGGNPNLVRFDTYALPGKKWDGNNSIGGQFSIGLVGGGNEWHAADADGRREIWEDHRQYTLEFYRFLTTDPAVPEATRDRFARLGLCRDEFVEHGHWPPALYVRESRRMRGLHVLSQRDILEEPQKPDPIAVSSFPIDSHDVQRIALPGGGVLNEGTIFPVRVDGKRTGYAYHVPYRAVLPEPQQCDNLLVPVALSCTHVGISSLRIEGAWMVIGQGAGVAAALAAREGTSVQDVDYPTLRAHLIAQGAVLELPTDPVAIATPGGILLDDADAQLEGRWTPSKRFSPHVGSGYLFAESPPARATFAFTVPETGEYELRMAYSPHPTRASSVPIEVTSGGTVTTFAVDQRAALPQGEAFRAVGRVRLEAGTASTIRVRCADADGFVILDALQLVPIAAQPMHGR
ncbi:MAG: hypothetical protein RL562_3096 [Planctomycetota bacterium]